MKIKTLGDFRKITENLDDDFIFDVRITKEIPKDDLMKQSYPYPWVTFETEIDGYDIGYSNREILINVCEK